MRLDIVYKVRLFYVKYILARYEERSRWIANCIAIIIEINGAFSEKKIIRRERNFIVNLFGEILKIPRRYL